MIKDAGANKREPPGILSCQKCAKYREGADARRLQRRKGGNARRLGEGESPIGYDSSKKIERTLLFDGTGKQSSLKLVILSRLYDSGKV